MSEHDLWASRFNPSSLSDDNFLELLQISHIFGRQQYGRDEELIQQERLVVGESLGKAFQKCIKEGTSRAAFETELWKWYTLAGYRSDYWCSGWGDVLSRKPDLGFYFPLDWAKR